MSRSLITRVASPALLRAALARVEGNGGAPGVDGVSVQAFSSRAYREIASLSDALRRRYYCSLPLLRVAIPKTSGGERYLAIPTVRDRVAQAAVYLATWKRFDREFESCSYGYRRSRSVRSAIERVRELRDQGFRWVVDADIVGYFDNIPHAALLTRLERLQLGPAIEGLFRQWIVAEVYDGVRLTRLAAGVPQGSVVSPMMANLYLDQLDERLLHYALAVVRYADDFVILCRDEGTALDARELTEETLAALGLQLHPGKTRIRTFREGFRFLGATFMERGVYYALRPMVERETRRDAKYPPPLTLRRYLELKARMRSGQSPQP